MTRPERLLWQALERARLSPIPQPRGIFGRPDFMCSGKVAVFADGEFWHTRTERTPNTLYWRAKIARNMRRDAEVSARLAEMGYVVVRFSEAEIDADADACARKVGEIVRGRRDA